MKCVCDYTEIFIAALCIMQGYNNAQVRASNIQYNSLRIHKSNVKLPELDVFSQHIVVIYLPM